MFSKDVLARLGELNRHAGPSGQSAEHAKECEQPVAELPDVGGSDEDVSQLPLGEEVTNIWGQHWIRRRRLSSIWPQGDQWLSESGRWPEPGDHRLTIRSRELCALRTHLPGGVIYLDLETCGFSGSMIFLVGLIHQRDGQYELAQLLARTYAEEKAMLQTLWSIAAEHRVLATFNGKSFDWPMVHDRSTVHHLGCDMRVSRRQRPGSPDPVTLPITAALTRHEPRPELIHCDLLHHARRRWKSRLPDCRLQTLERYVCRRHRTDDIPGREIPSAYHDFVRSGDAWLIRSVLHHNALDLVTLLQLSLLLVRA